MKNIDRYADWTKDFWFSGKNKHGQTRPPVENVAIMALGLCGESGECVEHIKKLIRDDHLDKEELKKELGDTLYYWARICSHFGFKPSDVIKTNIKKLESRRKRDKLRGDGDNR